MFSIGPLLASGAVVVIGVVLKPLSRATEGKFLPSDIAIGPQLSLAAAIQLAAFLAKHSAGQGGHDTAQAYQALIASVALMAITTLLNRLADEEKKKSEESKKVSIKQYSYNFLSLILGLLALCLGSLTV